MSFFGFDPNLPPKRSEVVDFQETYDGFGEKLEGNDAFNDETFGSDVQDISNNFDFGYQASNNASKVDPSISYAQAVQHQVNAQKPSEEVIKPLEAIWGQQNAQAQQSSRKVFSLEELEANLRAGAPNIPPQQQRPQMIFPNAAGPYGHVPPPGYGYPQMVPQNQGYVNYQAPMNYPPPMMQGMPPPGYQQVPQNPNFVNVGPYPPQQLMSQQAAPQPSQVSSPQAQAQAQASSPSSTVPNAMPQAHQNQAQQIVTGATSPNVAPTAAAVIAGETVKPQSPVAAPISVSTAKHQKERNLDQFPVLGTSPTANVGQPQYQQPQQSANQSQQFEQQSHQQRQSEYSQNNTSFRNSNMRQEQYADLSPEEKEKLDIKFRKLDRIMRYNNIMTPRDKDFVTRLQIMQIVTDDPFNEDFYFQIYKAIKNQNNNEEESLDMIAQYYLERSGHKLGGKHSRADIALQRMQQQVTKAVSVAKDRPKNSQYSKEGSLGKISIGSGKTPRKQLELLKKEIKENAENNADIGPLVGKMMNLSTVDFSDLKLNSKVILNCLEKTYQQVLKLESMEKNNETFSSEDLWNSLYIDSSDSSSSSTESADDQETVKMDEVKGNIFVSFFNYDKGVKLFPRILRYLTNEQKFKLTENVFKKISILNLLNDSSYAYYREQTPKKRAKIDKSVELFTNLILRNMITYISSELKFDEIIKLISNLVSYNSVVKLLPNKIGLTLITILISKIELLKQDINFSGNDSIIWSNFYDKLFNILANRMVEVFPKDLYVKDDVSLVKDPETGKLSVYDDSHIWHFLASLALAGKLQHQRIIVDEVREKVFECVEFAKTLNSVPEYKEESVRKLTNLNLFLNVMGLNASENGDITELK